MAFNFKIDPDFKNYWTAQTAAERLALALKIETEGPRPGSIVLARLGKELFLIDGHHTHAICLEKQIPLPEPVVYNFPNRESVISWIDENQRARRNAPAHVLEQRRQERIDRERQARVEGKSIRAIAEAEGVSKTTVAKDVAETTVPGGTVVGRDNKERPAAVETRPAPAKAKRPPRESYNGEASFSPGVVTDHLGKVLRELDKLARQYGLATPRGKIKETPQYLKLRRLLEVFEDDLAKWRARLAKTTKEN